MTRTQISKKVHKNPSLGTLINVLLSIFCIKYAMSEHSNYLNQLVKISSKFKIYEISITFYWNPIVIGLLRPLLFPDLQKNGMGPEWTPRGALVQLFVPHSSQGPWNNVSLHRLPTQLLRSSEIQYFSGRTPSPPVSGMRSAQIMESG